MSAVCGLDIHSESTYATVLGPDGRVVVPGRVPNGLLPRFLRPLRVGRIGVEASIPAAPLYRRLVEGGYEVLVSHPKKTHYIAEARIKSDLVHSRVIAKLVRLGSLPLDYMPPREIASLREKIRRRAFLIRERSKLKVKVRNTLAYEGLKPPGSTASSPVGVWGGFGVWV
jgi:hypothetical protein